MSTAVSITKPRSVLDILSERLRPAIDRKELVVVVGTGSSLLLTENRIPTLSWPGLVQAGLDEAIARGKLTSAEGNVWRDLLASTDLDALLAAAEFAGRKLGAPTGTLYSRWFHSTFEAIKPSNSSMSAALQAIRTSGTPICTLNYDDLIETSTGLSSIPISDTQKASAWMRREADGVLHLHGLWRDPATCILGIRDYQTTLNDDVRDLFQRSLATYRTLLFIGCGETFADPNFSALVEWLRKLMVGSTPRHFALVASKDLPKRLADPSWHGFVEPVSYGDSYGDLPAFLRGLFAATPPKPRRSSRLGSVPRLTSTNATALLEAYRAFLVRDCGQMTIEGVRADMETAQRRFDIERLFVPLSVRACPPELSRSDPDRLEKLKKWEEENGDPQRFGAIFAKHRKIALLALPGGGKTMLLKRLAVAYASGERRESSNDSLPKLDIEPVLIRCREWRAHIRQPIGAILRNLSEITGQSDLDGLHEALAPLLKAGKVLLLIDGLDEIHDDGDRATFVDNLSKFVEQFPRIRVVVTSREAGFGLVAPSIAGFCSRWRIASLDQSSIRLLCGYWHRLMSGEAAEAATEAREVANLLTGNPSLRRLAENPLLLTMLLVVKHGAGRLPPDRVTLYQRAVEVLLDTWNIKGHEALNLKEAIPQLACIAFELFSVGKQTATERELLDILEAAREKIPQIRRYATGTPHSFLKRVELRSSLLLEAGYQLEGERTVPFYQFRHLTFQEYLAALAAADGHYLLYSQTDSVLTPLLANVTSAEWREVVPMAAVLAGKQAEPLMLALVREGEIKQSLARQNRAFEGREQWLGFPSAPPAAVARLAQCLAEEAQASPGTLAEGLNLVAFFARGGHIENWAVLCRGPYGSELLHQAFELYLLQIAPNESWIRNTLASASAFRRRVECLDTAHAIEQLKRDLQSGTPEDILLALSACAGELWNALGEESRFKDCLTVQVPLALIEQHIFSEDENIWHMATWTWGFAFRARNSLLARPSAPTSPAKSNVLDRLLDLWLSNRDTQAGMTAAFALETRMGMRRNWWRPQLDTARRQQLRAELRRERPGDERTHLSAALVVAFHSADLVDDRKLAEMYGSLHFERDGVRNALAQLGVAGAAVLRAKNVDESQRAPASSTKTPKRKVRTVRRSA